MGLLSTEVEVLLAGVNIKWYEAKGYEIPRIKDRNRHRKMVVPRGTKIIVKIDDLPHGSEIKIKTQCDCCGKTSEIQYCNYLKNNHDGKTYCRPCAMKIFNSKENSHFWKADKTDEERIQGRAYPEYKQFIKSVLARDNYTCQYCGKRGGDLEVHHLDGYDWCKDKRTIVTNGITLCDCCHSLFHSIYGLGGNTKEQYETWVKKKDIILQTYNGEIPRSRWAYCVDDSEIIEDINCYAKIHGFHQSSIYKCCNGQCNTLYNKIYMWYDDYIKLSSKEITTIVEQKRFISKKYYMGKLNKKNKQRKSVVCTNFKMLFNSALSASIYFGVSDCNISRCCSGKRQSAGKYNGEKLIWKYSNDVDNLEEYISISDDECKKKFGAIIALF